MSVGIGWDHTRTHTGMETTFHAMFADFYAAIGRLLDAASQVPEQPRPLRPSCAYCWGKGRVFEPAGNNEGLVPRPCPRCDGRPA